MNGIGILNPLGALALAAVAVLVALYLYDRRRRIVPVATLFLWRQLPPSVLERRRFRPDLLFLLQLALLLALIAGYVRPYLESEVGPAGGAPLAIVLDVSASMQAREAGGTRFELARRRARAAAAALASGDEAILITAAERPHVALRWTPDTAALQARLEELEPLDTPTRLGPAIELALGQAITHPGVRVTVLTDLAPEESGVAPETLARVDYLQIGVTDDNVAITSLTVEQPPFRGSDDATATAVVRNYGRTTRRTVLAAAVDGTPWAARGLTLPPGATEHVLLTHPPQAGTLVATLDVSDALPLDDEASAWIAPGEPLDLLLVTDSHELAAAFGEIAAAIAGSRVEIVSPSRYAPAALGGRRVALFDGVVPDAVPPAVNALYVAPPPGNTLCPTVRTLEHAAVIDWDPEHPALQGMDDLRALAVARTSELTVPDWGAAIVVASARHLAFPFLVAGERDGRRIACLGAPLAAPLASSDALPLLVVTLGTLRWLAEPFGGGAVMLATGVPALAGRGPTAPVAGPQRGAGLLVAGDPPVLLAERAGVYRLGPAGGERFVLANLFDDRESDIGRSGARDQLVAVHAPVVAGATRRHELAWWLYALAAAFLATEWAVWAWREGR